MIEFKDLEASDVEVRVARCTEKGCQLLLYKDARCDMRLLDAAVEPEGWQCDYSRIGETLYCRVGVKCDGEWVWKEDCGVPSNMEADKGEASDAFKRACTKWGIGRELYTAPFVWVPSDLCELSKGKNGKFQCLDRFIVTKLKVKDKRIVDLEIVNDTKKKTAWSMLKPAKARKAAPHKKDDVVAAKHALWASCKAYAERHGAEARAVSDGCLKRPDFDGTAEWYMQVAAELDAS